MEQFALISKNSKEFQGHGWGCCFIKDGKWEQYKNIKPVWEDEINKFGETILLVAHARSAFRDEGIVVENNMPFFDGKNVFIFNGELRGVRIKEEGRIGAEKIFNLIKRINNENIGNGLKKAIEIIKDRTKYIRAMNIVICDRKNVFISSLYNEDQEYFQMHIRRGDPLILCSDAFQGEGWETIANNTMEVIRCY